MDEEGESEHLDDEDDSDFVEEYPEDEAIGSLFMQYADRDFGARTRRWSS